MKIIIVGCGKVGTTLAEQLNRENHDITLIDCDSEALQSISDSTDVMSVTGNGAVYQVPVSYTHLAAHVLRDWSFRIGVCFRSGPEKAKDTKRPAVHALRKY